MKGVFQKRPDGSLVPADDLAEKILTSIKVGEGLSLEAKKARNVRFHRKFFVLLNLAFEVWEPDPCSRYAALGVRKEFEKFRKDIVVLAGHFIETWSLDGELTLEAKSISFANMDELEFREVYSSVLSVVWSRIMRHANYESEADVDRVVNELLRFD